MGLSLSQSPGHRRSGHAPPTDVASVMQMRELEECPPCAMHGANFGFLPAHSYVFPATNSDVHRAEAYARVAKVQGSGQCGYRGRRPR